MKTWLGGLMRFSGFLIILVVVVVAADAAQQQPAKESNSPSVAADDGFSYSPLGRRDPFKALIEKKKQLVNRLIPAPKKLKGHSKNMNWLSSD